MTVFTFKPSELEQGFQVVDQLEKGDLYLLLDEDSLELAVCVDGPLKNYSTAVFLTGQNRGKMWMQEDDAGSGAWRVARIGKWSEVRFVVGPRAPNQAMALGMLGLLRKGPALRMFVGADGDKKAYLDLATLIVGESREDFAHPLVLLDVRHPVLWDQDPG